MTETTIRTDTDTDTEPSPVGTTPPPDRGTPSEQGTPRDEGAPSDRGTLPDQEDDAAGSTSPTEVTPASADEIPDLRVEIDAIDAEILRLVQRRTEISHRVGLARMAAGGPRMVYNREMQILARFRELGPEGRELAMLLLRLGRGRLGRGGGSGA